MKIGENFDNNYEMIRKIGINDSNNIYIAFHDRLKTQVIIKEYIKNKNIDYRKIDILKHLHHPNIPYVFDLVITESGFWAISEFIDGETIDRLIQQNNPFSQKLTINLAMQLIDVLFYLHSNNIICGNLRPENIILTPDKKLVLSDYCTLNALFPIKNFIFTDLDNRGYDAPEQNKGEIDIRTDIYGFGTILFYMLTGISPSNANTLSIREINSDFMYKLDNVIIKCTQLKPDNRYQNFREINKIFSRLYKQDCKYRKSYVLFNFLRKKPRLRESEIAKNNLNSIMPSAIDRENIHIFLSYCHHDKDLADIICNKFKDISYIRISRYTTDVPYKGSFKEFMNTLRKHDKIIMIISDQYLKSRACMYEVGQSINIADFQNKILFVICSNMDKKYYKTYPEKNIEAKIYDPHERNQYIIFWEEQCHLLENDLNLIKDECAKIETLEIIRDIKKIISNDIGLFMKYLADAKGISFDELYQHGFKEFFDELRIQ